MDHALVACNFDSDVSVLLGSFKKRCQCLYETSNVCLRISKWLVMNTLEPLNGLAYHGIFAMMLCSLNFGVP